jgi:hypothetical protein
MAWPQRPAAPREGVTLFPAVRPLLGVPVERLLEGPMSNSAADGVRWTSVLDGVVAETAAGRLLPGVQRCLLRVETPRRPEGWTAAATTHPQDRGGLDAEVGFRIASVTK